MKAYPLHRTPPGLLALGHGLAGHVQLPAPSYRAELKKARGNTPDIIREVQGTYADSRAQVLPFAPALKGRAVKDTCRNVWALVRANVAYHEDPPGVQQPKTPARMWADKAGDCKSYSIMIGSLLWALGIRHAFRYVAYGPGRNYSHVYVVAWCPCGKTYALDACLEAPFRETTYYKKKDVMTDIYRLSGLGCPPEPPLHVGPQDYRNAIGDIDALEDEVNAPLWWGAKEYLNDMAAVSGDALAEDAIEAVAEAGGYDYSDFGIGRACRPGGRHQQPYRQARRVVQQRLAAGRRRGAPVAQAVQHIAQDTRHMPVPVRQEVKRMLADISVHTYEEMGIGSIGKARKKKGLFKKVGKTIQKAGKAVKKVTKKIQPAKLVQKVVKTAKKGALAPARNAYLALVALNFRHWASKLSRANQGKLKSKWESLGGKYSALKKAVASGKKKKGIGGPEDYPLYAVGMPDSSLYAIGEPATGSAAALLAQAAPIASALAAILKSITPQKGETPASAEDTVPTAAELAQTGVSPQQAQAMAMEYGAEDSGNANPLPPFLTPPSQNLQGKTADAALVQAEANTLQAEAEKTETTPTAPASGSNNNLLLIGAAGVVGLLLLTNKGK